MLMLHGTITIDVFTSYHCGKKMYDSPRFKTHVIKSYFWIKKYKQSLKNGGSVSNSLVPFCLLHWKKCIYLHNIAELQIYHTWESVCTQHASTQRKGAASCVRHMNFSERLLTADHPSNWENWGDSCPGNASCLELYQMKIVKQQGRGGCWMLPVEVVLLSAYLMC